MFPKYFIADNGVLVIDQDLNPRTGLFEFFPKIFSIDQSGLWAALS